ncbi:hypothetical protein NliqN6_6251 [Naganishia liquefaciens]|uniref:3-oxo-5-alpha-steroid 4-dehydrogenase C-terminal domain-containing protein n=1 Tax=Naganishia liquefaciens TaxID=104408 RepID=A0A8H3TZA4_9TREE|nr:hypothetical protein NliqN6_6251 [Naganishia liquefaciens]
MFTSLFYSLLKLYHTFPLHSPVTLLYMDAPWGRFAYNQQRGREGRRAWGDLDGNLAWAFMEIVSPITFTTTILRSGGFQKLSLPTVAAACMFLIHYAHRAIISPLILAPKRSPQHIWVTASSVFFNLLNGYMMGSFIASDPLPSSAFHTRRFWLCTLGWLIGFLGNVYHDELLHDLRHPSLLLSLLGWSRYSRVRKGKAKATAEQIDADAGTAHDAQRRDGGGRDETYKIPRGGLFYWIAFPNYTCEWFEWLCYALLISPNPLITSPPTSLLLSTPCNPTSTIGALRNRFIRAMSSLPFPTRLLTPPYMFLIAELSAMLPRAIRAVGWYDERFGAAWRNSGRPDGRWVAIPGIL